MKLDYVLDNESTRYVIHCFDEENDNPTYSDYNKYRFPEYLICENLSGEHVNEPDAKKYRVDKLTPLQLQQSSQPVMTYRQINQFDTVNECKDFLNGL